MVVKLRLARHGQKNRPFYRIVATYVKRKRDGRHLEVVGRYNPRGQNLLEEKARVKRVWLDVERIKYWLAVGAQPSETVARLLGTSGILPISPRTERKGVSDLDGEDAEEDGDDGDSDDGVKAKNSVTTTTAATTTAAVQGMGTVSSSVGVPDMQTRGFCTLLTDSAGIAGAFGCGFRRQGVLLRPTLLGDVAGVGGGGRSYV